MKKVFLSILLILGWLPLWADWHPVVYSHTPQMYGGGTQNWQIGQSSTTGWIYAANNYGLLEYDGTQWRLRGIHNSTVLRSVKIGQDDKIYVGGEDEFGVFYPAPYDERVYRPLSDGIPENYRPFGEVWNIHQCPNSNLYFQTRQCIFETDTTGKMLQVIQPGAIIYTSLLRGNNLYLATDIGIYLYTGGRLHRLNGEWEEGTVVCDMVDWGDRIIIGTDFHGLYSYDGDLLRRFEIEPDHYMSGEQLYSVAADDDQLALGTVSQGVILIDREGHKLRHMSREQGLQNNTILSLFYDRDHNLWVGEDLGIDHISLLWPTEVLGLNEPCGVGYAYRESDGYTYLGTNQGVFYLAEDHIPHLIEGTAGQVWRFQEWNGELMCCHNRGLFHIKGTKASHIDVPDGVWSLRYVDDTYAYACTYNGVYLIERSPKGIRAVRHLTGYNETMFRSTLDRWGRLWAISSRGIICLTPDSTRESLDVRLVIKETDRSKYAVTRTGDGECLITGKSGIFRITQDGIERDSIWTKRLGGNDIYSAIYPYKGDYITVNNNGVRCGDKVLFDMKDFFVGGFDNARITPDSTWVVVGGTSGYYRIHIPLAQSSLPNHPWKAHEHPHIIPWWKTWWSITIFVILCLGILGMIAALIRNIIIRRDERLAREKEQEIHRQQMRILQLENDKAKYELEEKSHQLNHALLGRVNRNEIIAWVQQDMLRITAALQKGDIEMAKRLVRQTEGKLIAGNKRQDKDWENFEESFDVLNPEFVATLKHHHPNLTEQEVKLCVYIQQGLLTKEIGPLLHLSTRGVEMMRYRLHSKMGIQSQISLKKYFDTLEY